MFGFLDILKQKVLVERGFLVCLKDLCLMKNLKTQFNHFITILVYSKKSLQLIKRSREFLI